MAAKRWGKDLIGVAHRVDDRGWAEEGGPERTTLTVDGYCLLS